MTKLGLQLYTVRDHLERDFEGTLRKVAELGYQGVEFAGFYGRTAEQVQEILRETGLTAIGAHTPYTRLKEAIDEELAFNKAIGSRYIIVPYLAEEDRNRWSEIIEDLKKFGEKCKEEDLVLCYHNHDFELTLQHDGKPVLDAIYEQVPEHLLQVELDSCWVAFAGANPLDYIATYTGRLPLVHWKDVVKKKDGSPDTVELGRGEIAITEIGDAAIAAGVEWLIVEQDHCAGDSLTSIQTSMEWVRDYAQKGGKLHV
ncbi:sugar phosphate isomerase/epimerase family protein [Paenibacillus phoenicis]|uniref:sugar phosphate isomerase/epimerase family protein n=1 Tax=Paenibacillus phoenicis TaxID=554117 RepID=UPI003D273830